MDLNADLGEGMSSEDALLGIVTSANIACGGHAGTTATMTAATERAHANGVALGAHPSYPDREGFGRRKINISAGSLTESLREQIGALQQVVERSAAQLRYIKPHGALYHAVMHDSDHAGALVTVASEFKLPLLLAPQASASTVGALASDRGVAIHGEGFVDRGYSDDGYLLDRAQPGGVLANADRALAQALSLARGSAPTVSGSSIRLAVSSLCVHGDTPDAVMIAERVRAGLVSAGVNIGAWSQS